MRNRCGTSVRILVDNNLRRDLDTGRRMTRTRTQSIHDFVLDHVARSRGTSPSSGRSIRDFPAGRKRHLDAMVEAGLLEEVGQTGPGVPLAARVVSVASSG